ncbi:MAG: hypothetical protein AAFY31_00435, partial [Pseudomonadota bacterium]
KVLIIIVVVILQQFVVIVPIVGVFVSLFAFAEDWDDDDELLEYDDDDDDEDFGEAGEYVEIPEALADDADWVAIYESGFDFYSAVEAVYPELAGADHAEIEMAVSEMLEGMSEAEIHEFFSRIKKAFRSAGRFAKRRVLPVVRRAAPVVARYARPVGTAVGTAFGNPMLGAKIGGAVGAGAGLLSNVLGPPRRVRRRSPMSRRMVRSRRTRRSYGTRRRGLRTGNVGMRLRRGSAYRTGRGIGRAARGAGQALFNVIRNPGVQQALRRGAHGAVNGLFGEDYGMSDAAILEAIIGGAELALAEMEDIRGGELAVEGGYGPEDFESSEAAFDSLIALVEGDGA